MMRYANVCLILRHMTRVLWNVFGIMCPLFGFSGYKMKEFNLLSVATEHIAYVEISYLRHVYIR
jgi:hypothetical protein